MVSVIHQNKYLVISIYISKIWDGQGTVKSLIVWVFSQTFIFKWESKVIQNCTGFTSLPSLISAKILLHSLNQSDACMKRVWKVANQNQCSPGLPSTLNPLHPNISIHILLTVLYTLPKVLTRRICLLIKSFFRWWSFPLFSLDLNVWLRGIVVGRK